MTRSKSFGSEIGDLNTLREAVFELLESNQTDLINIRLLGVGVSNLQNEAKVEGAGVQLKFKFDV